MPKRDNRAILATTAYVPAYNKADLTPTQCGLLHKPVLYLSHYFRRHRQAYYDHLQAVRDHGAWEAWLEFFRPR